MNANFSFEYGYCTWLRRASLFPLDVFALDLVLSLFPQSLQSLSFKWKDFHLLTLSVVWPHYTSKSSMKNISRILWLWLTNTGAGHIIRISSKSWFISLIPFKKWNLYNVYIHSTQTDIFQVFISFNFDDYNWQLMKTPNSVSQKIRILLKTNTKKGFLEILANWKVWTWKVWGCTALNT